VVVEWAVWKGDPAAARKEQQLAGGKAATSGSQSAGWKDALPVRSSAAWSEHGLVAVKAVS
jgi:hypothetical protein